MSQEKTEIHTNLDPEKEAARRPSMTPIPPIPEDVVCAEVVHIFNPAIERLIEIEKNPLTRACLQELLESRERIAKLTADLSAMTEDRDLWQGEHNEDCPNAVMVKTLEAQNTRQKEDLAAWKSGASAMTGYATRTPPQEGQ